LDCCEGAKSDDSPVIGTLAENLGQISVILGSVGGISPLSHQPFVGVVQRLAKHPSAATRKWVAFSFPALVVGEVAADFKHILLPLFATLAKDADKHVRHTLTASLHEVLKVPLGAKDLKALLKVAFPLLASATTPTSRTMAASQLIAVLAASKELPVTDHAYVVAEYVKVLEGLEQERDWRTRDALFRALEPLPAFCVGLTAKDDKNVPPPLAAAVEEVYDRFLPILFETLHHGAAPVKPAACRVLCQFLRFQVRTRTLPLFFTMPASLLDSLSIAAKLTKSFRQVSATRKVELLHRAIRDLAQSKHCWDRVAFAMICAAALNAFSMR
jgi:hypothetical protein